MKQYTVNCADGDCNYVTLKVNSKLHHDIYLLTEGTVIELLECHPLYYPYEDRNNLRVCLLLSNFQIILHQNVPDNLKCAPTMTRHLRPIIEERIEGETSASQSEVTNTSSLHESGIEGAQDGWYNHDDDGEVFNFTENCTGMLLCVNGDKQYAEQSQTQPYLLVVCNK
jgi:hypothetical protein